MLSVTIEAARQRELEHMLQSMVKRAKEIVFEALSEHFEPLSRQKLYEWAKSVEGAPYVQTS